VSVAEQHHLALPKLYGAPAYARPPAPVAHTTRPFDPDDLPLAAAMAEEERAALAGGAAAPTIAEAPEAALEPSPDGFSLRSMTERLLDTKP
jgi:hypothetical protein